MFLNRTLTLILYDINATMLNLPLMNNSNENIIHEKIHPVNVRETDPELLVVQYTPLVKSIVNKYKLCGIPFDDLMQEGLLGLLEAQKRFDENRGAKFTTYAVYWIRNRILEAIKHEGKENFKALELNEAIEVPQAEETIVPQQQFTLPAGLPPIEKEVMRMYFIERKTLAEIAVSLHVSREKARQIRQKAFRRLRVTSDLLTIA